MTILTLSLTIAAFCLLIAYGVHGAFSAYRKHVSDSRIFADVEELYGRRPEMFLALHGIKNQHQGGLK